MTKKKPLTKTQLKRIELYAQARVEGMNQSAAFRKSHAHSKKWKAETVHNNASAFEKISEVQARIEALTEAHRKRHEVTVDSLTAELDENRDVAKDFGQAAAMTSATMGKAKLHGLITDKSDITSKGESLNIGVEGEEPVTFVKPNHPEAIK